MRLLVDAFAGGPSSGDPFDVLLVATLRNTLVLVLAIGLGLALRRAAASVRHRVYALGLLATVIVPLVWAVAPAWRVGVVSAEQPAPPADRVVAPPPVAQQPLVAGGSDFHDMFAARPARSQPQPPRVSETRPASVDLPRAAASPPVETSTPTKPPPVADSTPWPGWRTSILILYGTGTVAGLLYVLLGIAGAQRIVRRATPVGDPFWLGELRAMFSWLRVRRPVALLETQRPMSPVAWGWLRPKIVLPADSQAWSPARRRSVLLHELAHVERADWLWQIGASLVTALWWFHPLVWYVVVQMRKTSEQAADDFVVSTGGQPARYAEELLSIATGLTPTRWPGPAQAMFRSSRLEARLKAILDPRRRRQRLTRRLSWLTLAVALAVVLPLATLTPTEIQAEPASKPAANDRTNKSAANSNEAPSDFKLFGGLPKRDDGAAEQQHDSDADPAQDVKQSTPTRTRPAEAAAGQPTLRLKFVDAQTAQPVDGVFLEVWTQIDGRRDRVMGRTRKDGSYPVRAKPGALTWLHVETRASGYAPVELRWESEPGQFAKIPTEYTAKLDRPITIGGTLQDDQGQPAAQTEFRLEFYVPKGVVETPQKQTVKTDDQGHWQAQIAPSSLDYLAIRVRDPKFPYIEFSSRSVTPLAREGLRTGKSVLVVPRGLMVAGRVLDADGRPVPGADVLVGDSPFYVGARKLKSDANGSFSAAGLERRETTLTVNSPDFAPHVERLDPRKASDKLEVHLMKGRTVDVEIIDEDGKPVEAARVSIGSARQGLGRQTWHWNGETDSSGHVRWDHAPAETIGVAAGKRDEQTGRRASESARVRPADRAVTMVLHTRPTASIDVVDAETSQPIKQFTVVEGVEFGRGPVVYQPRLRSGRDGHYEHSFYGGMGTASLLKIEAPEYAPGVTPLVSNKERGKQFHWTIRLKRKQGPAGIVQLPDGSPVAGATLVVVPPFPELDIAAGQPFLSQINVQHPTTKSDTDGEFQLPAQEKPCTIVALNEHGYAAVREAELKQHGTITLQPWGKITGTIRSQVGPIAGRQVRLDASNEPQLPRVRHTQTVKSDEQGHFELTHVPPGAVEVHLMKPGDDFQSLRQIEQCVLVRPGETTAIQFGNGRTVRGQISGDASPNSRIEWQLGVHFLRPFEATGAPGAPPAPGTSKFLFTLDARGRFEIHGVPPGDYKLSVNLYQREPDERRHKLGTLIKGVHVPSARADDAGAIDLGVLTIARLKRLVEGEKVPDFSAEALDGGNVKLSELSKGEKYVVLDFWATWCGPCVASFPDLKKAWEEFGDNDRVVFLGLSLDEEFATVVQFVDKEKANIPWPQAYLGPWSQTPVPTAFGIEGIPALFVIGPDGRLIKRLGADHLADLLRELLSSARN